MYQQRQVYTRSLFTVVHHLLLAKKYCIVVFHRGRSRDGMFWRGPLISFSCEKFASNVVFYWK